MTITPIEASAWAEGEFGGVELQDVRRTKRLVRVASAISQKPSGTLPSSFDDRDDLKAAYRLLSCPEVTYSQVVAPHIAHTQAACVRPGEYLIIEDTTEVGFSHRDPVEGMGLIGPDHTQGLLIHTALAARVTDWSVQNGMTSCLIGIARQLCWTRSEVFKNETERERLQREDRESKKWVCTLEGLSNPPAGVSWTVVADRESDIYEFLLHCKNQGFGFVIRASRQRKLLEDDCLVMGAASSQNPLGTYELHLRARPGKRARKATITLRSRLVHLRPPRYFRDTLPVMEVWVVEALEEHPPNGVEAMHWVLLTNHPCELFEDSLRVVHTYEQRWLIEEYHKALKSGTHVEEIQLCSVARIQALLGILVIVAVRLLNMKLLARADPEGDSCVQMASRAKIMVLDAKFGKPEHGWKNKNFVIAIARLGGFLARKNDGDPGWMTIWKGWQRLELMAEGVETVLEGQRCG